jgi:hypothetical protein
MENTATPAGSGRSAPRVAAVVLNWNGWRDTIPCLESLRKSASAPSVIVVDNGSTDDSLARIASAAPWIRLLSLSANLGFSAGVNAGIAAALADGVPDYLWVLNNDTVVASETLSRMLALADSDTRIGIVGCRLVDADGSGRVQAFGGGRFNPWLGTTSVYVEPTARACDHLVGASLLLRRSLLEQIGGFDERYFFYLEDTDLSLRARRAGWRLEVANDATVMHRRGASISGGAATPSLSSDVQQARSAGIFAVTMGLPWMVTAIPLRLLGMAIRRAVRGQMNRIPSITRAYAEGLRLGRSPRQVPSFRPESAAEPSA